MGRMTSEKAVVAVITIVLLAGVGMGSTFSLAQFAWAEAKEIGPNEVQGKVVDIYTNIFRKGTITVKSDQTGKTYTFYVGRRTAYVPWRYPNKGETVKVHYIDDRGYLKATRVEIVEGSSA
jgi:hypothetical protein